VEIVEHGMRTGALALGDPVAAALMLWSTAHGFVHLTTHEAGFVPDIDLSAARDQVVELAVRALLPTAGA
jgi:hypothetical protein